MTWLSIDGGNEAKAGRACYVACWESIARALWEVKSCTLGEAREMWWTPSYVVVERTQADGRLARGTTTPAVMVGLAWNTAAVAYTLARGAPVHEYTPNDWIGGTPKAALHSRILAALSPGEREIVAEYGKGGMMALRQAIKKNLQRHVVGKPPLKHAWFNVLDAVGVGLFHLGRVGKGAAPVRA